MHLCTLAPRVRHMPRNRHPSPPLWKLAFQKLHCSRALAILTSSDCECTTHTPSACSGQLGLSRLCWGQASTTCVAFWWTELTSENPSEKAPLNWQWSVPIGLAASWGPGLTCNQGSQASLGKAHPSRRPELVFTRKSRLPKLHLQGEYAHWCCLGFGIMQRPCTPYSPIP